jgi:hypothetical protein
MSAGVWVSLFGIIVGAVITLAVAHMARKQARQIELHRADPSVPLTPSPHPLTAFLTKWWFIPVFGIVNACDLVRVLLKTTPLTRMEIFEISSLTGNVFWSMALMAVAIVWDGLMKILNAFVDGWFLSSSQSSELIARLAEGTPYHREPGGSTEAPEK